MERTVLGRVRADGESRLSTYKNPSARQKLTRYGSTDLGDAIPVSTFERFEHQGGRRCVPPGRRPQL
jgi:hypothetical protein